MNYKFFLWNRSFRFGAEWSFNILHTSIDSLFDRLTLSAFQPSESNKSVDLKS